MLRVGSGTPPRFSSLSESGFIPTIIKLIHGVFDRLGSHLFQRVASFLPKFVQSLSVEGSADVLISFREWLHSYTRIYATRTMSYGTRFSSLSESGFIPTSFFSSPLTWGLHLFSSLSESGFIPTELPRYCSCNSGTGVLISFREWLHSYKK